MINYFWESVFFFGKVEENTPNKGYFKASSIIQLNRRVRENSDFPEKSIFSAHDPRKVRGNNGDG